MTQSIFSQYKDITRNAEWWDSKNQRSAVLLRSLIKVPESGEAILTSEKNNLFEQLTKNNLITLAFATGEAGAETWGGAKGDDFALSLLEDAAQKKKYYIISTGGAAGTFTCASPQHMNDFIHRYYSSYFYGLDFDIETGYTSSNLVPLMTSAASAQKTFEAKYGRPLRVSLTLATLAKAGNSLNAMGQSAVKAAKDAGLDFYVNLMVMDYGSGGSDKLRSDKSNDMGESAIYAAQQVSSMYNIPLSKIELTAMIGQNDVAAEITTLADVKKIAAFVKDKALGGMHIWSWDRDCYAPDAGMPGNSGINQPAFSFSKAIIDIMGGSTSSTIQSGTSTTPSVPTSGSSTVSSTSNNIDWPEKAIVGYVRGYAASWATQPDTTPQMIRDAISHGYNVFAYAFGGQHEDGTPYLNFSEAMKSSLPEQISTIHQNKCLAIMSVGGGSNSTFKVDLSGGKAASAASAMATFLAQNGFDGLDIDVEHPEASHTNVFLLDYLMALKGSFKGITKKDMILTAAPQVSGWYSKSAGGYAKFAEHMYTQDFINQAKFTALLIQTYNQYGGALLDGLKGTDKGFLSMTFNLLSEQTRSKMYGVSSNGLLIPRDTKIVLGVPNFRGSNVTDSNYAQGQCLGDASCSGVGLYDPKDILEDINAGHLEEYSQYGGLMTWILNSDSYQNWKWVDGVAGKSSATNSPAPTNHPTSQTDVIDTISPGNQITIEAGKKYNVTLSGPVEFLAS